MRSVMRSGTGQATLEYALVMFALLASIVAMGAFVAFLRKPAVFESAYAGSAHVLMEDDPLGRMQDMAVF